MSEIKRIDTNLLDVLKSALASVCRLSNLATCLPLFILVVITAADVVARYFFASSVPDTAEISGMLLGICISLSLPFATLRQEQVRAQAVRAERQI